MNKKIFTILFSFLFIFTIIIPIKAEGTEIYSTKIPDKMLPYSEIKFVDSTHYVILEGGLAYDLTTSNTNDHKTPGIPEPVAGVTVTYASDGYLQYIYFPDGVINPLLQSQSLISASSSITTRVIIPDGYSVVAQWGSNNNTLYQNEVEEYRIGVGRGTTFSDAIGQGNLTNIKGSVATKLAYDNIDLNTIVRVSTINSSGVTYARNMKKTDAGSMPDAIVDIWKTGVEYWGYTWNSSFSMPYTVTIGHAY
ncbi:MAG: hypothetical protein VB048_10980 [Bacteroidaceae bacterium]|nr:hypothetical protein [Bacteroidaceae bacterium]MEA5017156.1 hypothetical protein [Erysipelotrichaceae bacterium]